MRVGIVGSGLMGAKLGTLFARAGHDVVFSYARSEAKLAELAVEAGPKASHGTVADAVRAADAVLLAVHWSRLDEVLRQTGDMAGAAVLTCMLPMGLDDAGLVVGMNSSGAEVLAARLPDSRVVSAFGTVPSEVLFGVYEARAQGRRPSLVYCGEDAASKSVAAKLIRDIGFEPLDAGPLRIARYMEPFGLLVGQLAYEGERGAEMAYRFEWGRGSTTRAE